MTAQVALQPVEAAGDGGRVQAGAAAQRARAERVAPAEQVQAVQVDVADLQPAAHVVVEQRQLNTQLAYRVTDRGTQPTPVERRAGAVGRVLLAGVLLAGVLVAAVLLGLVSAPGPPVSGSAVARLPVRVLAVPEFAGC